jgi:hypothetical protein
MNYFRYAKGNKTLREEIQKRKTDVIEAELESFAITQHYSAIHSKCGRTIGVIEDKDVFMIGDRVELHANCDGFIAPNISEEGLGTITKIRLNGSVRYGVKMDNGDFGYVHSYDIWKKHSSSLDSE